MPPKFTAADVVRKYEETGVTPHFGQFGAIINAQGVFEAYERMDGRRMACALGIVVHGQPAGDASFETIEAMTGVRYWRFADGFDGYELSITGCPEDDPDFVFGREVREAVLARWPELTPKPQTYVPTAEDIRIHLETVRRDTEPMPAVEVTETDIVAEELGGEGGP